MFQEILIVRENHVMQRMIVSHKNSCVIADTLESDRITIEGHFMTKRIVVEPKVIEAVTGSLPLVSRVTDIKHDSWLLVKELFKDNGYNL